MKGSLLKRSRKESSHVAEDPLMQVWVENAEYGGASPGNNTQHLEIQAPCSRLE